MTGAARRAWGATGRFLWSFFVDDTPEVPIVVAAIVGAAVALGHWGALAVVVLPLLGVGGLTLCVWRGCRARSRANEPADPASPV